MTHGRISIIIPTLNSARTLATCLGSLARQTVRDELEVLVVDGGSTDATRRIAHDHGAIVLENPWIVPERAKGIGLNSATGEFGVFLDSDEELVRDDALERRRTLMDTHHDVHNIMCAGMRRPPSEPLLSEYANSYGDPFSYFLYRIDGGDIVPDLIARYRLQAGAAGTMVFHVWPGQAFPICDAGSHFFRLSYVREHCDLDDPSVASRLFMLMTVEKRLFGVVQGDYVLHHSRTTPRGLWSKIDWRVRNNIYGNSATAAGHVAREGLQPKEMRRRQVAFLPYGLLVAPALVDAMRLAKRHSNLAMLAHGPLAFLTAADIVVHRLARAAGLRFPVGAYGGHAARSDATADEVPT